MDPFVTAWMTSPIWQELVARMIPHSGGAPGAGLVEPAGWRERLAWRRGAKKKLVAKDISRIVRQLILLATDREPELRFIGIEEGARLDLAVTNTLMALDAVDMSTVQTADLLPERLAALMRRSAPGAAASLTDDRAKTLYDDLLLAACTHLVEHFTHLDEFQTRTAVETRQGVAELRRRIPNPDERAAGFEEFYRQTTINAQRNIRLHGLGLSPREQSYELSTAYINLSAQLAAPSGAEPNEPGHRLEDLLQAHPRLLLEGPAGAGKTTLLQHLSLHICKRELPARLTWLQDLDVMPFLLRLRRCMGNDGLNLPSPEDLVGHAISAEKPEAWVTSLFRLGRALVMVDGIDEIPEQHRPTLMSWLGGLVRTYPYCRFLLTARHGALDAYQHEQLAIEGFSRSRLEPMTTAQVDDFIIRWHATTLTAQTGEESARQQAQLLIDALATRRDLSRLATNPLLCAMLCALNRTHNTVLPRGRNALYDAALTMLMEARDRERRVHGGSLDLSRAQAQLFLSAIAMWMTLNGRRTIDRDIALNKIERLLPNLNQVRTDPETVLKFLHTRSGLLQEPGVGLLEFRHPSFQDYLAAADAFQDHNLGHLIRNAQDPLYHDVIIMAVGQSQNDDRQNQLLNALIEQAQDADLNDDGLARTLWLLAGACIADVEIISPELTRLIRAKTEELLPPKNREDAGILAKAGEFVFDLVANIALTRNLAKDELAATILVATLTAGDDAIPLLKRLTHRRERVVRKALVAGWYRSRAPERYAREVLHQVPLNEIVINPPRDYLPLLHHLAFLQHLNLKGTGVSDLAPLANLTSLRHLIVTDAEDIQNLEILQAALPELVIITRMSDPTRTTPTF